MSMIDSAMVGALRQLLLTIDSCSCGICGVLGAILAHFSGLDNGRIPAAALPWFCSCNSRSRRFLVNIGSCSCGIRGVVGAILALFSGLDNGRIPAAALAWFCSCHSRSREFLVTIDACSCGMKDWITSTMNCRICRSSVKATYISKTTVGIALQLHFNCESEKCKARKI
jgi:hypothetical protein